MADAKPTFYITTPIYYVNDRPHIGHAYTTTLCDIAARFQRFAGRDVHFLTGTDEHGHKVEKSARDRGVSPQSLADANSAEFRKVLGLLNLTNDDFIRTTEKRHTTQVQAFVKRLIDSGDVYVGEYEGWYDEGQEEYVTDTKAAEQEYKSAISGKPLIKARERNYFFRLSKYQQSLEALFEAQPGFVRPEARRNEVLGRLREGLQDIPISRTNFTWGIPVPGDEQHVIYVWVDALFNYVTALGGAGQPDRARFWPADYHVVGKEILFFHAVIWPALLMALGMPTPKCVYAHSFWIAEGRKMSKSLGNFIDLEAVQDYTATFSLDAFRWFLVTQGPLGATDADFSRAKFIEVYNTDLANTLGNSANRVANMISRYFDGAIPDPQELRDMDLWACSPSENAAESQGFRIWKQGDQAISLKKQSELAVITACAFMERFDLVRGLSAGMDLVRAVDFWIDVTKPFSMAKDPSKRKHLASVLYQCAEALRIASLILWPALPAKIETLWKTYGLAIDPARGEFASLSAWGGTQPGTPVAKADPLFPRFIEPAPPASTPAKA